LNVLILRVRVALGSLTNLDEVVESVQCEVIGHKKRLAILNNLIQVGEGSESDSDSEDENVQLRGDDYGEVPAYMDGADTSGGYERKMPARFDEERDDRLMNSIVANYAREIKYKGKLTGVMMLNLDDARALVAEVNRTHKGYGYGVNPEQMSVEDAFNHFDVNHDGLIEAERTPQCLRYLNPNGALDIELQ
jgi:hypothetical protein